jgi:DNA-binding transcriptional ArsR family regulator
MTIAARPSLDLVFAALSDATRRGILEHLRANESTVGELAAPFDMSLQAASKHLRVLEKAGLLQRRIVGRSHYLKANLKPLDHAARWIEQHRQFWEGSFDRLEKYLRDTATKTKP